MKSLVSFRLFSFEVSETVNELTGLISVVSITKGGVICNNCPCFKPSLISGFHSNSLSWDKFNFFERENNVSPGKTLYVFEFRDDSITSLFLTISFLGSDFFFSPTIR